MYLQMQVKTMYLSTSKKRIISVTIFTKLPRDLCPCPSKIVSSWISTILKLALKYFLQEHCVNLCLSPN